MRTHSFHLNTKPYEGTPYHGQTVTWDVPENLAEAVGEGKMFETEKALLNAAVAQANIKRGHVISDHARAVKSGEKDENGKALTYRPLNELAAEARTLQYREASARKSSGKNALAAKAARITEKAVSKLATYSAEKLEMLVELEVITAEARDAEIARRKAEKAAK